LQVLRIIVQGNIRLRHYADAGPELVDDRNPANAMQTHLFFADVEGIVCPAGNGVHRHYIEDRDGGIPSHRNQLHGEIAIGDNPDEMPAVFVADNRNGAHMVPSHKFGRALARFRRNTCHDGLTHCILYCDLHIR
jgi:hypothetical protein